MTLQLMKLKIHRASVTDANINYEGSITIDGALMDTVGMHPYERVLCGNMANGERFETYAIVGEANSSAISLNGATAHFDKEGDLLTIMSFASAPETEAADWKPKMIVLGKNNATINVR